MGPGLGIGVGTGVGEPDEIETGSVPETPLTVTRRVQELQVAVGVQEIVALASAEEPIGLAEPAETSSQRAPGCGLSGMFSMSRRL